MDSHQLPRRLGCFFINNIKNMKSIIAIVSDFGDDFAVAQLVGVIKKINHEAEVVILANDISPFNIGEGAFVLAEGSKYFPQGTIFVGVIDPGVGTSRRSLVLETDSGWYVGPDNGLFTLIIKDQRIKRVTVIHEDKINETRTATFHGRDVFAHVAAKLSLGQNQNDWGASIQIGELNQLKFRDNEIIYFDCYGNAKINQNCDRFSFGDKLKISCKSKSIEVIFGKTFGDVTVGDFVAYKGSNNCLELAINQDSVREKLGLRLGQILQIDEE